MPSARVTGSPFSPAFHLLTLIDHPSLIKANRNVHRYLTDGVRVECRNPDGTFAFLVVRVIDYDHPTPQADVDDRQDEPVLRG
jgi:hypothetical protein